MILRPGIRHLHELVIGALLIALFAIAAWLEPRFASLDTQLDLSSHAAELLLLALPMTLIIISGGIDLSVGSTMALASVVLGLLFEAHIPLWLAGIAAIATGAAAGALNGLFIARIKVHPLIVTLASFSAYRGLAEGISRGKPISGFPDSFQALGSGASAGRDCRACARGTALPQRPQSRAARRGRDLGWAGAGAGGRRHRQDPRPDHSYSPHPCDRAGAAGGDPGGHLHQQGGA